MEPTFDPIPYAFRQWMQERWLGQFIADTAWAMPTLETIHFIGMCLLFGPVIVMDLRLLGFNRTKIPLVAVHGLVPVAIAGFSVNLLTGIAFLFYDPHRYLINISFQLKMVLVLAAGLNAVWYWLRISPHLDDLGLNEKPPVPIRLVGLLSLLAWTGVLCFGRMIPYLGTG